MIIKKWIISSLYKDIITLITLIFDEIIDKQVEIMKKSFDNKNSYIHNKY